MSSGWSKNRRQAVMAVMGGIVGAMAAAVQGQALANTAAAPAYPQRPIKLVVPFAPGGSTDIVARLVAEAMHAPLGQSVVVENKAGAGGMVGAEAVARAAPDGYTVGLGSISTLAVNPVVLPQVRVDPLKDLAPVVPLASIASVFSVKPELGVKDFSGFVRAAKAQADRWAVGSSGVGSVGHLILAAFNRDLGLQLRHIPYKGMGPVVQSVLSGETQMLSDQYPSSAPHIQNGLLQPFAVAAEARVPALPHVPTLAELGYPELNSLAITWFGLVVPAGTPQPVVARLNAAANAALQQPALRARLAQLGVHPLGGTPAQLQQMVVQTTAVVRKLVQQEKVMDAAQ
ncbi:MAG: tripartite tricarboxylate transporter substrate-binding protein [Comamonas sp.]